MSNKNEVTLSQNTIHGDQTTIVNYEENSQKRTDFLEAILNQDLDKIEILITSDPNDFDPKFKSKSFIFAHKRNKMQSLEIIWTEWKAAILEHVRELVITCVQNRFLENEPLLDAVCDKYLENAENYKLLGEKDFDDEFNSRAFVFSYEKNKPKLLNILWKNWEVQIQPQIRELFISCVAHADVKNEKLLEAVCRYNFAQVENCIKIVTVQDDFDSEFKSKAFEYLYYKNNEDILIVLWNNWKSDIFLYVFENKNMTLFNDCIKYSLKRKCTEENFLQPYDLLLSIILNGDINKMDEIFHYPPCKSWHHQILVEFTLLALRKQKYEQIKYLIKISVWSGYTVLDHAINHIDEDLFRLAVLAGANPYMSVPGREPHIVLARNKQFKDVREYKDLHEAVYAGNELMTKAMLNKPETRVDEKDNDGLTPLLVAARNCNHAGTSHTSIIAHLVEKGANIYAMDYELGFTALYLASWGGNVEAVRKLTTLSNLNLSCGPGCTPLHVAARCNHLEVVDFLLKSGADTNFTDYRRSTALHMAAEKGFTDIVQLLLKYGANLDAQDKDNKIPLDLAQAKGHLEIVKLIQDFNPREQSS